MIGIYVKVKEEGKEEIQLEACKSLANEEYKVYSDLGNTRVAREEMLNDINNRYITSVITYNLSRLSREQEETKNILELLNDKNIKLITVENGEINKSIFSIFSDLDKIEKKKVSS